MEISTKTHHEIELINKLIFRPCRLELTNIVVELESQEYAAHSIQLNGQNAKFRAAKITPTKTGQFVTIWKRNEKGITEPFSISDNIAFYIITTRKDKNVGFFLFPKRILYEKGILSDKVREGKRGIRVYPPWDEAVNNQAQKTQQWQTEYFVDLSREENIDFKTVKNIVNLSE